MDHSIPGDGRRFIALLSRRRLVKSAFRGATLPHSRRALLSALFFYCTFAHAQRIAFELQTHPGSPIVLVNFTPTAFSIESDRRQFVTVKNGSDKVTAAVAFQEAISSGSRTEIVTLEWVSIIIRPGEKKRLSVTVQDLWNRIQTAAKSGNTISKPVLSVVCVEFIDGSVWSAPTERAHT